MHTVSFTLTRKDVYYFLAAHLKKYPKQYIGLYAITVIFFLFGLWAVYLYKTINYFNAFFLIFSFIYIPVAIQLATNQTYKIVKPNGESKLILKENELEYQTEILSSATYQWKNILDISEHKKVYLLWVTDRTAYIVPRRIFDNDCQAESFYKQALEFYQKAKNPT